MNEVTLIIQLLAYLKQTKLDNDNDNIREFE